MIKFISYDGRYPNLCSGTLVLDKDGKTYAIQYGLRSGGSVSFDEDWDSYISHRPWTIDINMFPKELWNDEDEIVRLVNANVSAGCCGGCI